MRSHESLVSQHHRLQGFVLLFAFVLVLSQNAVMDETLGEPPTSAVFLDNCHFSQVIFNNVEKFYVPGGDITCYYTLTQHIAPRRKDWVGIFRVSVCTEPLATMYCKVAAHERNGLVWTFPVISRLIPKGEFETWEEQSSSSFSVANL